MFEASTSVAKNGNLFEKSQVRKIYSGSPRWMHLLVSFFSIVWLFGEFYSVLNQLLEVLTLTHEGSNFWNGVHLKGIDCDVLLPQESIHLVVGAIPGHNSIDLADEWITIISSKVAENKQVS